MNDLQLTTHNHKLHHSVKADLALYATAIAYSQKKKILYHSNKDIRKNNTIKSNIQQLLQV